MCGLGQNNVFKVVILDHLAPMHSEFEGRKGVREDTGDNRTCLLNGPNKEKVTWRRVVLSSYHKSGSESLDDGA